MGHILSSEKHDYDVLNVHNKNYNVLYGLNAIEYLSNISEYPINCIHRENFYRYIVILPSSENNINNPVILNLLDRFYNKKGVDYKNILSLLISWWSIYRMSFKPFESEYDYNKTNYSEKLKNVKLKFIIDDFLLCLTCYMGDIDEFKTLLNLGVNYNTKLDRRGILNSIYFSLKNENKDILLYLLEEKFSKNTINENYDIDHIKDANVLYRLCECSDIIAKNLTVSNMDLLARHKYISKNILTMEWLINNKDEVLSFDYTDIVNFMMNGDTREEVKNVLLSFNGLNVRYIHHININ